MSMIRKPKPKNWAKLLFLYIPITVIFVWGFYHQFYKSYPEIPEPPSEYGVPMDSPIVSAQAVKTLAPQIADGSIVELNNNEEPSQGLYSVLSGNKGNAVSGNNLDENKKKQWEEIIMKLKEDYATYSKLSSAAQETIMKFIEKNRVRDMLASAIVGAIISVLLTLILTRPVILKAVDSWLWKYVEKKE